MLSAALLTSFESVPDHGTPNAKIAASKTSQGAMKMKPLMGSFRLKSLAHRYVGRLSVSSLGRVLKTL
jgi:hypothetical protein